MTPLRWRMMLAAGTTAVLIATVVLALAERAPNRVEQSLTQESADWVAQAIEIPATAVLSTRGTYTVHRTTLVTPDAGRLAGHNVLQLLVATYATSPQLDYAELSLTGTTCVYRTLDGAEYPNNGLLTLVRGKSCARITGSPTGKAELTVKLRNVARLAVWTYVPQGMAADRGALYVHSLPRPGFPAWMVRGRAADFFDAGSRRRVDLLAYVWQIGADGTWVWSAIALGAILTFAGSLGFWTVRPQSRTRIRAAVSLGAAGVCLMAGLATLYSVLTPPFHAPDEPHHFMAFADLAGRPDLKLEADAWSRVSHFHRIQFRREEHFRPSDIGQPGGDWDTITAPDAEIRGSGAQFIWQAVLPLTRRLHAPGVLLSLRLTNVLVLSLTVGVFVGAVVLLAGVRSPHLLAFPLFFVPTAPFLGMHLSNHAPLLAAYVITGLGVLLIVLDRQGSEAGGFFATAGWASAVIFSRSAVPLAPLVGAVVVARLLLGSPKPTVARAVRFWFGSAIPLVVLLLAVEPAYLTGIGLAVSHGAATAAVVVGAVGTHPTLLFIVAGALASVDIALDRVRQYTGKRTDGLTRQATLWGMAVAAVAVATVVAGSLFVSFPTLERIDGAHRPPAAEYTRSVVLAGLTMIRAGRPDYLTSMTFWGGFGWLETIPDERFISLLAGSTGIALVGLLAGIARRRDWRRAVYIAAALLGFVASLAAYAFALTQLIPIDIVGRYLFGAYLTMLLICWSPLAAAATRWDRDGVVVPAVVAGVACATVHAYCLRFILTRYF